MIIFLSLYLVCMNLIPVINGTAKIQSTTAECPNTITTVNGKKVCGGKLIFNDPFSDLKSNYWTSEVRFAGAPDYEFVMYQNRPETLEVKKGHLHIRPVFTDNLYRTGFCTGEEELNLGSNCTGVQETFECVQKPRAFLIIPPVTSGKITTKNKFSFKYGKVVIRAKLPKGDWIYPELYLTPKDEDYGPDYQSGQMRVAFILGNEKEANVLYGGCLLGTSPFARGYGMRNMKQKSGKWNDEFHKFSLEWNLDHIVLKVDDKVYGNIYPPKGGFATEVEKLGLDQTTAEKWGEGSFMAPFDKEVYLSIGVGVGGQCFEDRADGTKPWSNSDPKSQKKFYKAIADHLQTWDEVESALQIDYVRVYAL